jgi:glycosyltransferase involved in cell wall biosynthesis
VPVVYYRIGAVLPAARRPPGRWWHSWLLRRASKVVCVSEDIRQETAALLGVPVETMVVIPNARDAERYAPGPDRSNGPTTIGFIGQLMPSKRPGWLLEAVEQLRTDGMAVRGTLVGEGPLEASLLANPASSAVEFTGRTDDIPGVLRTFDILMLSSTRQEGMPGVLIEAGLTGVPVVATDVPGVRDVVVSGTTGFVVSPDGPEESIQALRALSSDRGLRQRMGHAARRHCVAHYSLDATAGTWREVLRDVRAL